MKGSARWLQAALVAAGVMGACGTEPVTAPIVASLSLSPVTDTLRALGATQQLRATALDASGNPVTGVALTWSSAQPAVATVTSGGLVTAVGNGQAQITASASGVTGTAAVTVAQEVAAVTVTPSSAALTTVGATQQFTAQANDANNNAVAGLRFLWISSDPAVASVDTSGLATARRSGQATISAAARGVPGYATVGVTQNATQLAFRAPPPASTVAGEPFATVVQVEIRDAGGALVPDAQLPITLTSSGPPLHGSATANAINGVASFSGLWVETTGSGFTLTAQAGTLTAAVSPAFAITPAPKVGLSYGTPPSTDTAGAPQGVVVRVTDRFGNTDTSATDTVRVKLVDNLSGAGLYGATAIAAVGGVAGFPDLQLRRVGVGYTLRAVAAGLDSVLSAPFDVTPASPRRIAALNPTVTGFANLQFDALFAVRDSFDNKAGSGDVTIGLAAIPWPPATLLGTTMVPNPSGDAWFTSLTLDRPATSAAPYWLRASSPGLIPDSIAVSLRLLPIAVAAGAQHTCVHSGVVFGGGAMNSYGLFCWGANGGGQIGNPAIPLTGDSAPVLVAGGIAPSLNIEGGTSHTCMRTGSNAIYCWGANDQGQLGTGTVGAGSSTPVAVTGGTTWLQVTAGGSHTCAIAAADSTAYCWGDNAQGQLGDGGSPTDQPAPTPVYGGRKFSWITAGNEHTCAIAVADSTAYCWGRGDAGELGHAAFTGSDTAVTVAGGYQFGALSAGTGFTCGVRLIQLTVANVYCWGENGLGQLGDGNLGNNRATPDTVSGGSLNVDIALDGGRRELAAGGTHACVVRFLGSAVPHEVWCWGGSGDGQVGPNGGTGSDVAVLALDGSNYPDLAWGQIVAGDSHSCVLVPSPAAQPSIPPQVLCWGRNAEGQLGRGSTTGGPTPTLIIQ